MRTRNDLQASEPTPTAPQTSHGRQEFKENEKRRKSNHDVVSDKARLGMQTDIDAHQEDKTREKQKENALRLDKRMLAKTNAAQKIGGTNKNKIGDGANLGNHAQSIDVTLDKRKPEKGLENPNESAPRTHHLKVKEGEQKNKKTLCHSETQQDGEAGAQRVQQNAHPKLGAKRSRQHEEGNAPLLRAKTRKRLRNRIDKEKPGQKNGEESAQRTVAPVGHHPAEEKSHAESNHHAAADEKSFAPLAQKFVEEKMTCHEEKNVRFLQN